MNWKKTLLAACLLTAPAAFAQEFEKNLIVNPGAESGVAGDTFKLVDIPGWTRAGKLGNVIAYSRDAEFSTAALPLARIPGSGNRGGRLFTGGYSSDRQETQKIFDEKLTQRIDVNRLAAGLDMGKA